MTLTQRLEYGSLLTVGWFHSLHHFSQLSEDLSLSNEHTDPGHGANMAQDQLLKPGQCVPDLDKG